ncbi:Oxidoreductase, molybdopterin-binding domain-containing protein [Pisolithus marmoratus]|nr:Oxidoreductase, molybdopterin-binding domain-containing protein [Pisolithus marmoratus]
MGAPELHVLSEAPYNAEPPSLAELVQHPITPLHLIYARNHCTFLPRHTFKSPAALSNSACFLSSPFYIAIPAIKSLKSGAATYAVKIDGELQCLEEAKVVTYQDILLRFPRKEVVAALVCAGNRRATMADRTGKEVKGIKWGDGAACNVRWAGAPLRQVLLSAGVPDGDRDSYEGFHVCFASYVAPCEDDKYYGGSIPLADAMDEKQDALLAYEMNGEPLTPDHGFPLRIVVPGTYGMRWVKWVDRITISREESPNFYQQKDYKILPDTVTSREIAESQGWWSRVPSMQHLACNSVVADVCRLPSPRPNEVKLKVMGYAYSHWPISRVEISVDSGRTWEDAYISYQEGQWSWTLWEAELEFTIDEEAERAGVISVDEESSGRLKRNMVVFSRAVDSFGNEQKLSHQWNLRGVGYSGPGERSIEV